MVDTWFRFFVLIAMFHYKVIECCASYNSSIFSFSSLDLEQPVTIGTSLQRHTKPGVTNHPYEALERVASSVLPGIKPAFTEETRSPGESSRRACNPASLGPS